MFSSTKWKVGQSLVIFEEIWIRSVSLVLVIDFILQTKLCDFSILKIHSAHKNNDFFESLLHLIKKMGQITEINDEEFKKLNLPIINSKNSKVVIVDAEEDSEMKFDDDEVWTLWNIIHNLYFLMTNKIIFHFCIQEFFDDVNDPIPTIPNATSCKIEEISQEDDEKDQRLYAQTVAENFARLFYSLLQNPTPEAQQKLSSLFSENSTFIFQNDIVVGVAPILWFVLIFPQIFSSSSPQLFSLSKWRELTLCFSVDMKEIEFVDTLK